MATVIGDIAIQIGADIGPLVTNLNRAKGAVSGFGTSAQSTAGGGMRAFSIAGAAMGAAAFAAGAGLVVLTKNAIVAGGALNDASKATGVHVASLQAMSQVAEEASVSSEALISSLKKMQNNIAGLQTGTAAQVEAFGNLGLSMSDLQGKGADEQFALVAAAIDAMADPVQRTAAAMDIFGKAGADLIPMMDGYAASLADVAQAQRDFGISLSDADAAKLDAAGDAMGRVSMAAQGLGNQLAITFAPAIFDFVTFELEGWRDIIADIDAVMTETRAEAMFEGIGQAANEAAGEAEKTALAFEGLADGKISQGLRDQADSIRRMTDSFKAGAMTADEYRTRVNAAFEKITALLATIGQVNDKSMAGAISKMEAYGRAIADALGKATALSEVKIGATAQSATDGIILKPDAIPGAPGVSPGVTAPATVVVATDGGGSGAGGGGNNLADDLAAMQARFASEAEIVNAKYEEDLKKLEEFRNAKLLTEQAFNDLEAQTTQEHQDKLRAIEQAAMDVKLSAISSAFGDVASLMNVHNKAAFNIGKAAALSGAIIDGYSAATAAWAKGMKVGGPPVAAAFTAASLARTGAQIAGIASTQYGSTSGGASAGGGSAPAATAPLQASLNLVGMGDYVKKTDVASLLDMLNDEAGDRGYKLLLAS